MEYFTNGFSFKRGNFNLVTFNIFKDLVIINRSFRVKIIFHEDEDVFKDAPCMANFRRTIYNKSRSWM